MESFEIKFRYLCTQNGKHFVTNNIGIAMRAERYIDLVYMTEHTNTYGGIVSNELEER